MSISQNYPNVSPQLLIELSNTQKLDPRVTFARASTGTYYDANGVLQTAPSGVARFQFNPVTGVSEGLLVEEQRTNLLLRSEEFDNAGWTKSNSTITANTIVAPDGTLSGDKLVEGATTSRKNIDQTADGSSKTFSVYVKKAERSFVAVGNTNNSGLWSVSLFNLDTGTFVNTYSAGGSAVPSNNLITPVGNGWYRISVLLNNGSRPTIMVSNGGNPIFEGYTGDGYSGIYIWGAQLEANSYPTSYTKTVASQVTRAADVATLANVDTYNTDEFTAVTKPFGVSGVASNLVTLNGDAPIERLYVYPRNISQGEINTLVQNDGYWSWRIVGANFALPNFTTDGTVIVDWGDGTVETLTTAVHTFTNASPHTVRFKLTSGTTFRPRIINNATHKNKVVALGSAPSNMIVDCFDLVYGCSNLKSFDATLIGGTNFSQAWRDCSSLTSFPLIDTSSGTNFTYAWYNCSGLTSFPLINTSSGTSFSDTWNGCSSLTSFPLLDMSLAENLNECWDTCTSLTSFPAIDFPVCTIFTYAWYNCSSLTSFPLINTSSGTVFSRAWQSCSSLTSFPLIDTSSGTSFFNAWNGCSSLTEFPANFFDSWTGTPLSGCFKETWGACSALTTTSVENILVSIDTSGVSAPVGDTEITIDYDVGTGALTSATNTAITSLKAKNWTIKINGVLE